MQALKSGVYTSEEVSLTEGDPDSKIDFRIWLLQVFVWTSCIFIGKIVVFFQEITMYKQILYFGNNAMDFMGISNNPELQLVTVMIIVPVTFNSILFWVQDSYLKGDKHARARIAKEMEAKRLERLRLAEVSRRREIAKQRDLHDFDDKSESEGSIVDIQFKGRLIE